MRCEGMKADGVRCQIVVADGTTFCIWHDPSQAGRRRAASARKRGAKASAKKKLDGKIRTVDASEAPANPTTIAECVAYASWALGAVTTGKIDSRTAHEISVLLAQIQRGLKDSKLVDDVAALREQIAQLRKASR